MTQTKSIGGERGRTRIKFLKKKKKKKERKVKSHWNPLRRHEASRREAAAPSPLHPASPGHDLASKSSSSSVCQLFLSLLASLRETTAQWKSNISDVQQNDQKLTWSPSTAAVIPTVTVQIVSPGKLSVTSFSLVCNTYSHTTDNYKRF